MDIDTSEIKANIDCRTLAEVLLSQNPVHKAGKAWQWNCPFHQDKATPSFTVYPDGYKCFGCGASGDQFSLVMRLLDLSFSEAYAYLMRMDGKDLPIISRPADLSRKVDRFRWQDSGWQAGAARMVREGMKRLPGSPGADYLARRGITAETSQVFALGYEPDLVIRAKQGQAWVDVEKPGPAIIIPWQVEGVVQAIQYRFTQNSQRRFHQKYGGERVAFGRDLLAGRDVLLVVEGEMNAVSLWQESRDLVDVVSFGPESNIDKAAPAIRKLSKRYKHVIVWADKRNQSLHALEEIQSLGTALQSPGGLDANDLLCRQQLADFIRSVLSDMGVERPAVVTEPSDTIVLTYPADAKCPTIHGKWRRLEDGRIEAGYSRGELIWAMMAVGYEPTAEEMVVAVTA